MKKKAPEEIKDYDRHDTTGFIDTEKPLKLADLGYELPDEEPTKVVSIRIPTKLYNRIRAFSTDRDMPYQAYIKLLLSEGIKKSSRRSS